MKRARRRLLRAAAVVLGFVLLYPLLLAFPEPLFAHRLEERSFVVYSRQPIAAADLEPRIREVERRLERSEIFEPGARHRVFVTGSKALYGLLNGPYRGGMARNVELGNAILLPDLDEQAERVVHFDGRSAPLVEILTHEATHTLVQKRLGLLTAIQLPFWKKEGYAQYVGFDFLPPAEGARLLASGEAGVPRRYLEAAIVWSYLDQVKDESFDEIVSRSESMEEILEEALSWARQEEMARGSLGSGPSAALGASTELSPSSAVASS